MSSLRWSQRSKPLAVTETSKRKTRLRLRRQAGVSRTGLEGEDGRRHEQDVNKSPTLASRSTINHRPWILRTISHHGSISKSSSKHHHYSPMSTTDHSLLKKFKEDIKHQSISSDYGTLSESSASNILCRSQSHPPKDVSLGYASGASYSLDDSMSNLSIYESIALMTPPPPPEPVQWKPCRRSSSGRSYQVAGESSHFSLEHLKMQNVKTSLKVVNNIRVLIPLQGYEISPRPGKSSSSDLEKIISIDTFEKNIEGNFLKSGLRIFQVSPVISIQPCEVKFCNLYPAVVHVPLSVDPSSGDEVHCLYSRASADDLLTTNSSINWSSEEIPGKCVVKEGKVILETFRFGIFVLIIRPKSVYSSVSKHISAIDGGTLEVPGFPVKVDFPRKVTQQDISRASAKIYFDTEKSLSEFLTDKLADSSLISMETESKCYSLATPIIRVEPHGTQFVNPVMITLPVPDYDKIKSIIGCNVNLSIWQSDTHSSEISKWEILSVEYKLSYVEFKGENVALVTFPVSHFSCFKGMWDTCLEYFYERKLGMMFFFVSYVMNCQAYMQEYPGHRRSPPPISNPEENLGNEKDSKNEKEGGGKTFGLQVLVYREGNKEDSPPHKTVFKQKVGQSTAKLVKPGIFCIRLNSNNFGPDLEAGQENLFEEEANFGGNNFDAQFACKLKHGVDIAAGPFGKVLVTRSVVSRKEGEKIFKFNLQKQAEYMTVDDSADANGNYKWPMVDLYDLADSLLVTDGDNWKQFAYEMGMTKQEVYDANLEADDHPFQKIASYYMENGGSWRNLVDALYRCQKRLKVTEQAKNRIGMDSPGPYGSALSFNSARNVRRWSYDSNSSGKSHDSGFPSGEKRLQHTPSPKSKKFLKRKRLSFEPGPSNRQLELDSSEAGGESSSDSDDCARNDYLVRKNPTQLKETFLWEISRELGTPKWCHLGRTLKLNEAAIIEVNQLHADRGFREQAYQMLLIWREISAEECTFGNLFSALQKEGMYKVAKKMNHIPLDLDSK